MYLATPLLEIAYEYRISILFEALHEYTHQMAESSGISQRVTSAFPD